MTNNNKNAKPNETGGITQRRSKVDEKQSNNVHHCPDEANEESTRYRIARLPPRLNHRGIMTKKLASGYNKNIQRPKLTSHDEKSQKQVMANRLSNLWSFLVEV
jgi:hypothetical protein